MGLQMNERHTQCTKRAHDVYESTSNIHAAISTINSVANAIFIEPERNHREKKKTSKTFKMIGSLHALVRSYTRYLFSLVSGSLVRDFDFFLGFCVALENRRGEGRELAQSQLWSHTHTYKRTFTKTLSAIET